jgi:hypothetical protein
MNGDTTHYLSEAELATAIRLTVFPNDPGNPDGSHSTLSSLALHTADEIAAALFKIALARREEAARWIVGDLYIRGNTNTAQRVYRRETDGWLAIGAGETFRDGDLDTTGFRRLIPESRTAGPSPLDDLVPPYPAEDGPLKQPVTGLAGEFERLGRRLAAEDAQDQNPEHDVRGTAHSHAQGWYHNCPGCAAGRAAQKQAHPATESEH